MPSKTNAASWWCEPEFVWKDDVVTLLALSSSFIGGASTCDVASSCSRCLTSAKVVKHRANDSIPWLRGVTVLVMVGAVKSYTAFIWLSWTHRFCRQSWGTLLTRVIKITFLTRNQRSNATPVWEICCKTYFVHIVGAATAVCFAWIRLKANHLHIMLYLPHKFHCIRYWMQTGNVSFLVV